MLKKIKYRKDKKMKLKLSYRLETAAIKFLQFISFLY